MMTTFLVGAGLIAVPIIIHIFNRTRYKRIEWAAMEFLLNAYRKTRRRLRFENLLLLLLRVFAMLFIAFAFFPDGVSNAAKWLLDEAGISFTGGAGATKPQHLVLVLDDTASMRYRELQLTNFDNGIKTANDLLSRLNDRRDRVTLIRVSTVQVAAGDEKKADDEALQRLNRDVPVIDVKKARELLGHALPGYGTGSLLPALREAGRRIASMDDEKEVPRLSIISDMQANAWAFGNPGSSEHQTFVNIMEEIGAKLQKHNIPVMWHVVGQNSTRNRGITGLSLEDPVVGVGIPNSLNVQVGNFGSGGAESSEFKLTYRIDNEEERPFSQSVSVEPGMVRTIRQDIPAFQTAGCHSIQIKITDQDRLEDDNTRTIAFDVVEAVEILVVNGAPDDDFSKDEVAMFKLLLDISSWYNPEEGRKKTINRVSVVTERQLSTTDLSVYDVIAICNVGSVTEEFAKSLYDYLNNRGGSLVFTLGANVNADDYNTHFWREGKGLLPARLDTPEGDDADAGNPKLHTIKGVDLTPGTPFAMFDENDVQRALLENPTAMRRWYGVSTPAELGLTDVVQSRTLLSIVTEGAPELVVDKPHGRGYVALFTSTVNNAWNHLWENRGLSLWMFSELIRYCSSRTAVGRNLMIGEHFTRVLSEREQTGRGNAIENPQSTTDKLAEATLPDNKRRLLYTRTATPGLYRLKYLATDDTGNEIVARTELFSVAIDGRESDVGRLGGTPGAGGVANPPAVLKNALPNLSMVFDQRSEEDAGITGKASTAGSSDLWVLFIGLAMLFLVSEMGASLYFGRRAE